MFGRQRDPAQELARKAKRAFDEQSAQLNALQKQNHSLANQIARRNSQSQAGQAMDELKRGEAHYAQVVMLAGYAGFFTLWTQTKSEMSLWMFASTGALISISLMVFVAFELYKTWELGRFYQCHPHPDVHELNGKLQEINKHWHIIFGVSAGSGVTAGISLLLWFVYKTIVAAASMSGAA
jgi:hypothetical protein